MKTNSKPSVPINRECPSQASLAKTLKWQLDNACKRTHDQMATFYFPPKNFDKTDKFDLSYKEEI